MNIAAYCRVSTDKSDQLNSLETQKAFFTEYVNRTGGHLVKVYADEGISGTKIKNRKEFQQMMADAEHGLFDMVVVKDISRFARNTVDLLQSVRRLKALGIETQFLTANMTSMGNSEFVLTIFGALAQEESANTSKRIKFGKRVNAGKGRVPNLVFGYDKTIGDYYNLAVNEKEAAEVRQIFQWYVEDGYGCASISNKLNEQGSRTKRNCRWSQNAVARILTNEIYTGKIVNGKQEVADFLTGQREKKDKAEWMVTERPQLRIIADDVFEQAQKILHSRHQAFHISHERQSSRHLFSTLIKCKECGWSFRRTVRTYKNTYVRWVCSGHNGRGADSCPNAVALDEEELIKTLQAYFAQVLRNKKKVIQYVVKEFQRVYKARDENVQYERELRGKLSKLRAVREKYMDMYTDGLITRQELNHRIGGARQEMERLENELKMVTYQITKGDQMEELMGRTFQAIEDVADVRQMTNAQLKKLIQKIEVDKEGNVDIYLRLLGELGLQEMSRYEEDKDMRIEVFHTLPEAAGEIREEVFVKEQGFQEEFDTIDAQAVHLVLYAEGKAAGTCRFFEAPAAGQLPEEMEEPQLLEGAEGKESPLSGAEGKKIYMIGRLAVRKAYRGQGLGACLLKRAEEEIRKLGGTAARLHAQQRAEGFYAGQGYQAFGGIGYEEGCPHVWMEKSLGGAGTE